MYDRMSGKIRPTKINSINGDNIDMTSLKIVCTHSVAMTMEKKGILIPEEIAKLNSGHSFTLLKLAI